MRKIGIVTITIGENYGNRLQNYALQTYCKKMGFKVETVHNFENKIKFFRSIINNLKFIKHLFDSKYCRVNNFKMFNIKNIKYSKYYLNNNDYDKLVENKYDYFIAGSDQIWNLHFPENNIINFLGFIKDNNKKISYAASFGAGDYPDNYDKKINKYLTNIKYISVREDRGKELVKEITGRDDAVVLVDPTMLLTSEEWDKVSKKPKMLNNEKYILNYFLGELSKERKEEIERIAKENDCEIINILDKNSPFYVCGPSEFLYLEKHAFLICTDSFHSSVFAILYNRPFVIFDREEKGMENMGSRLDTLINKFKLKNRRYNGKNITKENLEHDYSEAYKILEIERKKSDEFLRKALDIKDGE